MNSHLPGGKSGLIGNGMNTEGLAEITTEDNLAL